MPVFYGLSRKILAKKLMITEGLGAVAQAGEKQKIPLKIPAALPMWIATVNLVLAESSSGRTGGSGSSIHFLRDSSRFGRSVHILEDGVRKAA
jgi:hypothetical protein